MKHTGRELELMVAGKKAMAAFCHIASENIDPTGGQDFESMVKTGQIRAGRFFIKSHDDRRLTYTVYYKNGEDWRFVLYKALKKSIGDGWNTDKEIIESILLDYDRRSLNEYLRRLEKRP